MKSWIMCLILVGIAVPLINCQNLNSDDDNDDYEVKRFNIQGRQLGGPSTCVVTRRKRSPSNSDGELRAANEDNDEEDQESEVGVSTADASDTSSSSGLLISDADLAGNAGILVIQNVPQPDSPLLFELRPVHTGAQETFPRVVDGDDPDAEDSLDMDNDMSDSNNNGYQPIEISETNFIAPPKRRRGQRRPQPKPTEVVYSPVRPVRKNRRPNNQRQPNRRKNQNKNKVQNQNRIKNRKRKPNANTIGIRNGNRRVVPANAIRNQINRNKTNKRRKNLNNRVDSQVKKNKKVGLNVNKGNQVNTYTKTVTTTHTGTANDIPDVNCIIINKPPPPPTTEKPFWNILGRSASPRQRDSRFGLRKRVNRRIA